MASGIRLTKAEKEAIQWVHWADQHEAGGWWQAAIPSDQSLAAIAAEIHQKLIEFGELRAAITRDQVLHFLRRHDVRAATRQNLADFEMDWRRTMRAPTSSWRRHGSFSERVERPELMSLMQLSATQQAAFDSLPVEERARLRQLTFAQVDVLYTVSEEHRNGLSLADARGQLENEEVAVLRDFSPAQLAAVETLTYLQLHALRPMLPAQQAVLDQLPRQQLAALQHLTSHEMSLLCDVCLEERQGWYDRTACEHAMILGKARAAGFSAAQIAAVEQLSRLQLYLLQEPAVS